MFYHVSKKFLGQNITLQPKIPGSSLICEEGDIPRICVSTKIYYCLRSITGGYSPKFNVNDILHEIRDDIRPMEETIEWIERGSKFISPAVYTCQEQAFMPPNACDFRKNDEHWYITPQEFNHIGYLDLNTLITSGNLSLITNLNFLDGKYLDLPEMMNLCVVKTTKNIKKHKKNDVCYN